MFERFDESARMVVVTAQEEARALRHAAIGGEHLVLGIANGDPVLLNLGLAAVREHVIARFGTGQTPSPEQMPFTATATKALQLAVEEATYRGQGTVRPAHLLLVLLRVDDRARSVVEALGRPLDEVRERAEATCERPPTRVPTDVHQARREGHPVAVTLGDALEIGYLGNPQTDARLLLAMLVANGRAAELLRDHGLDEDVIGRLYSRPVVVGARSGLRGRRESERPRGAGYRCSRIAIATRGRAWLSRPGEAVA
jgi:ATP-dependent Clp protease ATP-binding subunit ClpA